MRTFFVSIFGYFLSPLGLVVLAALDTSMLFFLPFAVDTAVIIMTARRPGWMLVVAALATAGSLAGAMVTYWIGRRAGEHGLERLVPPRKLDGVKRRVRDRGAIALAVPALLPPPFPLTPFILVCGALDVSRIRFFTTLAAARLVRFSVEAMLAARYGRSILGLMESEAFQAGVIALAALAVAGTAAGAWVLFRSKGHRASARTA